MKITFLRLFFALWAMAAALSSRAQIVVNEYSCANWKQFYDAHDGTEDWIELYNKSSELVDISGYHLSDDEDEPTKWAFPAGTFILPNSHLSVWCSGRDLMDAQGKLHTNFKLTQTKSNPEHLVLATPSGAVLQDIEVEKTQVHQSRARFPDGSNDWRIALEPSPGSSNNGTVAAIAYAARPQMSQAAGFYQGELTIALSTNEPNAELRFTLDGTEPSPSSPLYTEPIVLTQTTVVKATTFSKNPLILPSFVQFNTYFVNETHTLAVISVASDGVLELANGNQSLRPTGSIEYFDKSGERKTRTYGELNSHGQDSWANDQRSLDWVSRDEMGYNAALKEQLFPLTDRDEFQRIILRASGDDNYPAAHHPQNEGSAHVRDAYIHNLAKRADLHVDVRTAEKCIVYLNGQYWGVYDMRELPDDHDFTDYYYNQGKYDLQYVLTWGWTWAEYGGDQAIADWHSMRSFILGNNMNDPLKFQYVKDRYDYESLIDYVIINSFTVCSDWLNYNTGIWRGLNPEGGHQRWGYILWDNDATFGHYINYTGIANTGPLADPCNPEILTGNSDPEKHIKVLNKLRTNPEVEQYYISRQADLMATVFGCENMIGYLDSISALIDPEMERHALRWDGTYEEWQSNLTQLRSFILTRCDALPTLLDDCYAVTGPFSTVLAVEPPGAGSMKVNTLQYAANQFPLSGNYFGGEDVDLRLLATPTPNSGYEFDYWSAGVHTFTDPSAPYTSLDLTNEDTIVAHFKLPSSPTLEPNKQLKPSFAATPTVFEQTVTVQYFLPEKSDLSLQLFDMLGKQVAEMNVPNAVGNASLAFELGGKSLPDGVYFLRCSAGGFEKTLKLLRAD
jgi:hypothetical protein